MTGERREEPYIHPQYKLFSLECLINTFYHFTGVWKAENCLARVLKAARHLSFANVICYIMLMQMLLYNAWNGMSTFLNNAQTLHSIHTIYCTISKYSMEVCGVAHLIG